MTQLVGVVDVLSWPFVHLLGPLLIGIWREGNEGGYVRYKNLSTDAAKDVDTCFNV